ncbi:chromate transporter [Calidifontibacillus oryziterrae]|uniref:chromate transporter n=1 Tax=Calidifontibacillus oryziterrae TaxID=1191699 RepID=UPI0002F4A1D0|nr:chromate transporter [Calidifontibacillus oryziterrae]
MVQGQLFMAFSRVGLLGYGGGPSSIPLVHNEVVKKYRWLTDDEFSDIIALANTLPGPIATKIAGYIGYRVGGVFGMINAVCASIIPTILLMIILLTSLSSLRDQSWVAGMTKAVVPVVGVMLAVLTWDFFSKASVDLGWMRTIALTLLTLFLLEYLHLHPGIVIAALLLFAIFNPSHNQKQKQKKEGGGRV